MLYERSMVNFFWKIEADSFLRRTAEKVEHSSRAANQPNGEGPKTWQRSSTNGGNEGERWTMKTSLKQQSFQETAGISTQRRTAEIK
jgi:hypothetical protein